MHEGGSTNPLNHSLWQCNWEKKEESEQGKEKKPKKNKKAEIERSPRVKEKIQVYR